MKQLKTFFTLALLLLAGLGCGTTDNPIGDGGDIATLTGTLQGEVQSIEGVAIQVRLLKDGQLVARAEAHGSYKLNDIEAGDYTLHISANGYQEGKGTHVSIYAWLMKGENDDLLPWPFTGKVTIELLNQLEDKNHCSRTVTFPPSEASSQRVVSRESSDIGYGIPCYISHSALGYNAAKNCQYLKDDCLYFRIKVDAKSSSKPWLV